jgi:hypothetical protein
MSTASWYAELQAYISSAVARQLTEASPRATQPPWITAALRPHQLSLLAAARGLEQRGSLTSVDLAEPQLLTNYGVLADRVGAGKSLVALSLVRDPPPEHAALRVRESGGAQLVSLTHAPAVPVLPDAMFEGSESGEKFLTALKGSAAWKEGTLHVRTALFIVPHNVVPQWESYVREQTGLNAVFVRRTRDCDWELPGFYQQLFTADAVIVSCTMLRKFIGAVSYYAPLRFSQISWSRLFVDEADSIACSLREEEVQARFYWFITGSWLNMLLPTGLRARSVEHLPPAVRGLLGDGDVLGCTTSRLGLVVQKLADRRLPEFTRMILRNAEDWTNKSLLRPAIVHETLVCRAPANIGVLKDFISPEAMEALHAGDTAGALVALGLKAATAETLADRVTAALRGELIAAEKLLAFKRDMEYSSAAAKEEGVKKAEGRVERLRGQLADLEARIAGAATELCPICYDTPKTTTLTPCCRQAFCLACVCECIAKKPACPLCRAGIGSPKELLVIGDAGEEAGTGAGAGAEIGAGPPEKGAALLRLLTEGAENPDSRFLVFSAHEASFKGLRELLMARGIRCELLMGTAARVERLRRQFRAGEVRVLCMNARHVGAGINLEAATHVVLYHRMNVEMERQVIGRAVRFERAAELRVVHLVHDAETALNGAGAGTEVIVHV